MPVYYITELMGVAANLEPKALGIARHFVPAEALLKKVLAGGQPQAAQVVQSHGGEA